VPVLAGLAFVLVGPAARGQQPPVGPAPAPQPGQVGPGGEPLGLPEGVVTEAQIGPRLSGLPAAKVFGAAPIPTREDIDVFDRFIRGFTDPRFSIDLIQGKARLLHLREPPFRIQISDTRIFDYTVLDQPTELSLVGTRVGSTIMNMWFGRAGDPASQTIMSFLVNVLPDPDAKRRLEQVYKALQDEINTAFPDAFVCLTLVGDRLVLSGEAKDAIEAEQILSIVRGPGVSRVARNPVTEPNPGNTLNLNLGSPFNPGIIGNIPGLPPGEVLPTLENYILQGERRVVNLLRIPGEQQVRLKVILASVNRAAARSIGLSYTLRNNKGVTFFTNTNGLGSGNLPLILDNGKVNLQIEALRTQNMARNLAEPDLVARNGESANFFSGGEFAVPVLTGATAVGLQGVSYIPFGVSLQFTPIVTDRDRILLRFSAEVSALGPPIGSTGSPSLTATQVSDTVEMREGQTFAVGGLVQQSLLGGTNRVPLFGDLPLAGNLFRSSSTSAAESELVMLVTPTLVHPLEPNETPPLPGSDYFEPGDLEFYLLGRLESSRPYDYRSPVMNDINRMAAYRRCELLYFVGPSGHSDKPRPY
jgi:pilus assembly protein CpaC